MRTVLIAAVLTATPLACALPAGPSSPTEPLQATAPPAQPTEPPPSGAPAPSPTVVPATAEPTAMEDVEALPDPAGARWQPVASGFRQPVDVQHAGDDRLFVVEQSGTIRIIEEGQLPAEPFLDIRERVVDDANERGLLGLAFHPDFANNGRFYVNYTGSGGHTRIARFQSSAVPNRADPDSGQVLLAFDQPFPNHNGGGLAFGPQGYLYIGTGDGGSAGDPRGNAQNLNTLLGKMLRLDVDAGETYTIPADNPFLQRESARPEIWSYGLRNPWRFGFDPATGALYIADVGQNQWEEVNHESVDSPGGLNYGWDLLEGSHVFEGGGEGTAMPVAEYSHSLGCSVTGGVVVRDPTLPAWQGVYLYGDYCSGNIWGLLRSGGQWVDQLLFSTNYRVSSFGVGADGGVYLLDLNGGLYRFVPAD